MRLRIFLMSLALAFAVQSSIQAAPPAAGAAGPDASTTRTALAVAPYLQNPTSAGVTILWRTAAPAYGWVEYGETAKLGKKQDLVVDGLRAAYTQDHRVRLTGLAAGKTYFYRVGYRIIDSFGAYKTVLEEPRFSPVYQFRLPAPGQPKITCCFLNDLHNNYRSFGRALPLLRQAKPDVVIFNGDCFADTASEAQAVKGLQVYNEGAGAASRPVFYLRGNHETRGAYARQLRLHFDYPGGQSYFALTLGPVRFVVLDCGEDKSDDHKEYSGLNDFSGFRQTQAEWLRGELNSAAFKQAKYHVLVHHIPLYGHDVNKFSYALWSPILKGAPIDLAINAHTHSPLVMQPGAAGNPYPVVIGGGPKQPTLITLAADSRQCRVTLRDCDGKELGSVEIGRASLK
jgi:predicted phosphodiesterase